MITAALTAGLAFSAVPCIAASAEEDDRPVVFAETQQPETAPESGSETAEAEETGTEDRIRNKNPSIGNKGLQIRRKVFRKIFYSKEKRY